MIFANTGEMYRKTWKNFEYDIDDKPYYILFTKLES